MTPHGDVLGADLTEQASREPQPNDHEAARAGSPSASINAAVPVAGDAATRRGLLAWLAGAAALPLAGCDLFVSRASYRFRLTVEVETPQGIKTGSSVMEAFASQGTLRLGDVSPSSGGLEGEAVVVDLPGGPIFALLTLGDGKNPLDAVVTTALAPELRTYKGAGTYISAVRKLGHPWFGSFKAELSPNGDTGGKNPARSAREWPVFVRFRDINDPKSIERVNPQAVGVKHIWVETTGDPVTTGIEKRLVWFARLAASGSRLDGDNSFAIPSY